MITIPLIESVRSSYTTYESLYRYRVMGQGVHSRSHDHALRVYRNRPVADHPGQYRDALTGGTTSEQWSYGLSAQATVIAAAPDPRRPITMQDPLVIGQRVTLTYPDGTVSEPFTITARPLADPILTPYVA